VQPIVIGIAGGSGSGKSTLAAAVRAASPHPVASLGFDDYYRDQRHVAFAERERVNYDHPNALDIEAFTADLTELRAGRSVAAPIYDFAVHSRSTDVRLLDPHPIIVVDGILLFVFEEICRLIDLRVFVDTSDAVRTERRVGRDVAERGRTADYALAQIERTVRPMYGEFVGPSADRAHLVVDGTRSPQRSAQVILDRVGVALGAPASAS
jgi:uridine kinase